MCCQRESQRDLSALRAFIETDSICEPSRRGKNNLYKLFICRALDVLTGGGRLGFITPMAVLGDDQAADIRRRIVEDGAFTGIEAFPQKDDPTNRIFPEAKLSTAVFTVAREKFLTGKGPETKAFHHRFPRIGLQESCPQNNFRRIIAAYIPSGEFCNHKINYTPEHKTELPIHFLLALLNSKISDWYFRLGSTNAAVSHYQLYNLPCPIFASAREHADVSIEDDAMDAVGRGDLNHVFNLLEPMLGHHPFRTTVRNVISEAAKKIIDLETARGDIPRSARSALDPKAQPYQDLIDRLFFSMAGLSESEASAIEDRLSRML